MKKLTKTPFAKSIIPSAMILMASITGFAQDIHFSQIFETPLLRNPALSGIFTGDFRVQGVFRSQWGSVTVPYQTTSLNAEYRLPVGQANDFLTIGSIVLLDKAGTIGLSSTQLLPGLNYHKSLSADRNMYLSLGFTGGLVQRRFDRSKVTTNNQFDGTGFNSGYGDGETFTSNSYSYFDGSAGMSLNSQLGADENNNMYVGIACHHFNKPRNLTFFSDNNIEMTRKWVGSAGARFGMSDYSYFTLEADYTAQGVYRELMTGALYTMKVDDIENPRYSLHLGAYMRWKDAIIPVAKLNMGSMGVALSYDANISSLKSASRSRGGFEVSLSYQNFSSRENTYRDYVRCPKF